MGCCHFWKKSLRPGSQDPQKPKTCHPPCSLVKHEQSHLCLQNPRQHNPSQESGTRRHHRSNYRHRLANLFFTDTVRVPHTHGVSTQQILLRAGCDPPPVLPCLGASPGHAACRVGSVSDPGTFLKNRDSRGGDETFFLFQLPRHSISTH